ncbi:MAG TPA: O-antigen polymerase [Pyrinomonadaceae bacterium]
MKIPSIPNLVALVFGGIIIYGVIRAVFVTSDLPFLMPLMVAVLSIVALSMCSTRRYPMLGLARVGFHIGLFAYFVSFPILSPESVDPSIPDDVHQTIGLMLLLTVVGFEAGYYLKKGRPRIARDTDEPFTIELRQQKWLWLCVFLGMVAWTSTWLDSAYAAGVSPLSVLLTMRGVVEGAQEDATPLLGRLSYIFSSGLFLAAASAALLLTSVKRVSKLSATVCWLALLTCALLGFLAGTRAVFLYSFSPLVLTLWLRLSRLKSGRMLRWVLIGLAGIVLAVTWGAMSAMRGSDIRNYQGGLEAMNPVKHMQGAFDIYSQTAMIVETFPDKIEYEYGKSLIPLVLGWVPRSLWPDKPYPFSIFANIIRGETLEDRSASIAVGLPGEGYGNFGLFGVLLWSLLMGLACRAGDDYVGRLHPSNPLRLLLAATISIWAAMIVRGGVPEMFYMGLSVNMFPLALSWYLSRKRRPLYRNALSARADGVLPTEQLSR